MSETRTRTVAAFDFDGTFAGGDAVLPFFARLGGLARLGYSLIRMAPLARHRDRDLLKARLVADIATGMTSDKVRDVGERFAQHLLASRVRPAMVERLRWHHDRGHETVIVSASIDAYLVPVARELGFDHVLCTRLEIVDGRATGRLIGANVRGEEKRRLLTEHLNGDDVDLYAYGNSAGDHAMLRRANHPYWVSRNGRMTPWTQPAGHHAR